MGQCAGERKTLKHRNADAQALSMLQGEERILKLVFDDLALRSCDNEISYKSFQMFIHINVIWSRALFKKFLNYPLEPQKNLCFSDFVKGINCIYRWNDLNAKVTDLFCLYDVDQDKGISKDELIAILLAYPQEKLMEIMKNQDFISTLSCDRLLYFFCPKEKIYTNLSDSDELSTIPSLNRYNSLENPQFIPETMKLTHKTSERNSISKLTFSKKYYTTSIIKQYADFIFKELKIKEINDKTGKLETNLKTQWNFNEFELFCEMHPDLDRIFVEGLHEEIWKFDRGRGQFYFQESMQMIENHNNQGYCEETQGNEQNKKIYIFFSKGILYIFDAKNREIPIEIKTIIDLTVAPFQDRQTNKFGLVLCSENKRQKILIFRNKEQQQKWTKIFQQQMFNPLHKYKILNKIGQGSFSHVHLCQNIETGCKFAVKIIDKQNLQKGQLKIIESQWEILTLCEHPNIIRAYDRYETNKCLYYVTELLNEGSLFEYVKECHFELSQEKACHIIKQLLEATKYMHEIGLIHRDLKLSNILVKSKENGEVTAKIIDFGLAVFRMNLGNLEKNQKFAGTPGFVAPELYYHIDYDESIDIFSLGVILYFLLSGKLPFHAIDAGEVKELTCNCELQLNLRAWKKRSSESKDLLTKMLALKGNRVSCDQALKHPWFQNHLSKSL